MKKCTLVLAGLLGIGLTWAAASAATEDVRLERKRVAIFHEEGFPSKSPRTASWYEQVLKNAGCEVTLVNVKALCEGKDVTSERYDTLIVATGGYLPIDSEETVGRFMMGGGTVVVDGNMGMSQWRWPDEVQKEYVVLKAKYKKGEDVEAFRDFEYRQGMKGGGLLFRYSKELKRWIIPVEYFSCFLMNARVQMGEFELDTWPSFNDTSCTTSARTGRPFNEDLRLNPALKGQGFPEVLPIEVKGDGGERIKLPARQTLQRYQMPGAVYLAGSPSAPVEYANDLLIPVYLFDKASGRKYPGLRGNLGKSEKDRESDFYIYRSHTARKNGYTLVHFGVAGAHLLRSENGAAVFMAALKLAESGLPGEKSAKYIDGCNRLEKSLSRYAGATIGAMETWMRLARAYHYEGRMEDLERVKGQLKMERETFEELIEKGEWLKRVAFTDSGDGERPAERDALIKKCDRLSDRLEKELKTAQKEFGRMAKPPRIGHVKNRFERMTLGFFHVEPHGLMRLKTVYPLMKQLGASMGYFFGRFGGMGWERAKEFNEQTGIYGGFRLEFRNSGHPATHVWDMGVLNLDTGAITSKKQRGFETTADWDFYEKDAGWFLKKANEMPGVGYAQYLSERSLGWSMWDERMRLRLIKYLKGKYQTVETMNAKWGSQYKQFEEIKLPVKRPESREEHALWEDWTRYREVYYLDEEVRPNVRLVKKYAPKLFSMVSGSYCGQEKHPANGINYYEFGKEFDPSTFELDSPQFNEVIAADITGHHHRNLTCEWGAFYYPPTMQAEKIDLFKQELWKGVGWGQIGLQMFMGSVAGSPKSNLINANNAILPLGWQMRAVMDDLEAMRGLQMDGQREEPAVRVLYSPTTRRHTSWPGIEGDKSLEEIYGWYRALQMVHVPVRAIDEGAVLDEGVPQGCRILVLPQVTYMNEVLRKKVEAWVRGGGVVVMTADSGRYDEYGYKREGLLTLAGVASEGVIKHGEVELGGGRILKAGVKEGSVEALKVLYPETETALKYKGGSVAVVKSRCGKGQIVVSGVPFGQWFYNEMEGNPSEGLEYVSRIMDVAGLEREYECDDPNITIWPWEYEGGKYLIITSRTRSEMVRTKEKNGFPFERAERMEPFTLKVAGNYQVTDYLLGMKVPVKTEGGCTVISGLISSPGGVVYNLKGEKGTGMKRDVKKPETEVKANEKTKTVVKANELSLPYEGRLFESDGERKIGGYRMNMETKTGGEWRGEVWMELESESGEKIRQKCVANETAAYHFLGKTVKVACRVVLGVMPVNVECRISEEAEVAARAECRLREEKFCGQESVVLENEYIRTRILPGIGGRMIELITVSDGVNHLACNEVAVGHGVGADWANYGGWEFNAGAFPGPFWGVKFEWGIMTNTADEVGIVLKRTKPIKWISQRISGEHSLEVQYVLKKGKAAVETKCVLFGEREAKIQLRSHPMMAAGGGVNGADVFYYPVKGDEVMALPYMVGRSTTMWKNEGAWMAVVDQDRRKGLVQSFRKEDVGELYAYMGTGDYNFEVTTVWQEVKKGEGMTWEYEIGCIQGLNGLAGFGEGIGVNVELKGAVYGNREDVGIEVQVGSLQKREVNVDVGVTGATNVQLLACREEIKPYRPFIKRLSWNTGNIPDGDYAITVIVNDQHGRELAKGKKKLTIAGRSRERWTGEMKGLNSEWERVKERLLRKDREHYEKIKPVLTRIAIQIADMKQAIQRNELKDLPGLKQEIEKQLVEIK